jgi:membrane protein required for colicin V production
MIHFITHLNVADFIIAGIVLLSILISLLRGFIREALSLATWLIGVYLAFTLSTPLSEALSGVISSSSTRMVIAFVGIFLSIVILGAILNFFVGKLITVTGLGLIDRLLGVIFGAARGILVIALVLLMIKGSSLTDRSWWRHSQLIPEFAPITLKMEALFPKKAELEKAIEVKGLDAGPSKEKMPETNSKSTKSETTKETTHE